MEIITREPETLDKILSVSKDLTKNLVIKTLENIDLKLYSDLDKARWKLIRIDKRTILSTFGELTFKRRYYYDIDNDEYVYLLDNLLGIPKNTRITNELRLKVLDLACEMSYSNVGKRISNEFVLSKSTVARIIKDTIIEQIYTDSINRKGNKIHLQLDEKFIGMTHSKRKKRYYTLTIFAGKEKISNNKYRLLNKTVVSSSSLKKLRQQANQILFERYSVTSDEEIYISGDLATYIQTFKEHITVCRSQYVPDKFHVYHAFKKLLPDVYIDDESLNNKAFIEYLINELSSIDDVDAKKMVRMMKRNKDIFKEYLNPEYLGCSQEGQNSHIYAPRFGKYANRFNKSTIEKLALIKEAIINKSDICVGSLTRKIPDLINECTYDYVDLNSKLKYSIDTSNMKKRTRELFNEIIYGK